MSMVAADSTVTECMTKHTMHDYTSRLETPSTLNRQNSSHNCGWTIANILDHNMEQANCMLMPDAENCLKAFALCRAMGIMWCKAAEAKKGCAMHTLYRGAGEARQNYSRECSKQDNARTAHVLHVIKSSEKMGK